MKKTLIIYPFLFALFPVLFLYSYNIEQLPFTEVLLSLTIVMGFTIIALPILWLILKKDIKKAGIIITAFLVLFFSYGHAYEAINTWKVGTIIIGRHRYFMIVWAILFILCVYFTMRTRKDLINLTKILNAISIILILIPIINISIYEIKTGYRGKDIAFDIKEGYAESDNQENLPDIYYIILDGYASSNTLKEFYNYDNDGFTEFLREKGFYIADKSVSNYHASYLSIASSLNMEYINYLSDIAGIESKDQTLTHGMIRNNKVAHFLKSRDYDFIHFSSGWGPTNYNKYADLNIGTSYLMRNEFQMLLIRTTMIISFEKQFKNIDRRRILNTFDNLAEIYKVEGKKFVFAHIICPHPPYLFDRDGNSVPEADTGMNGWGLKQKEYYLNQLIFINKKIEILIDEILSKSEVPPIIILQADHGPRNTFIEGEYPTADIFKEGSRIFNAYYLPSEEGNLLYDSITPVNTFRVVFNSYFNTDYELLEDKSYNSFEDEPYRFTDITDMVDYD